MGRVGLIDVDVTTWRNLALMRWATHLKSQAHEVLFPYDGAARVDQAIISTVFTRNRPRVGKWLRQLTGREWDVSLPWHVNAELAMDFPSVKIGGTGWDIHSKLPPVVEACRPDYAIYDYRLGLANYGQGFTTRGCPRGCHFCVVPEMSGSAVVPVATLADLRSGEHRFVKLMDDNLLGNKRHALAIFEEALRDRLHVCFSQGLDIRFVDAEIAAALGELFRCEYRPGVRGLVWDEDHKHHTVTFAFDRPQIEKIYRRGFELLMRAGLSPESIASFVLIGFDTSVEEDMRRLAVLRELGALPYVMVYEPIHGEEVPEHYARLGWTREQYHRHRRRCKHLQRYCNRKALWKTITFDEYEPWRNEQRRWLQAERQSMVFDLSAEVGG